MPDDDSLLAQGTVEFRQAERDHANGRERKYVSPMELVTLRGGPLDGLPRHVRRSVNRVRFQRPMGDGRYWYERAEPGVWRYITHGRHCPCTACANEDWTRITTPCGMHGKDCPAIYAPARE